jgi:hypothetical protein
MNRTFKLGSTAVTLFGVLGILGAGCLSRPVTNASPNIVTNFTAVVHNAAVDKVDLLFMIDNSASMGDKQALLALAVPDMINRLVAPNCVDPTTNLPVGGTADTSGNCAKGKAEFPPVHDMHVGVVTSSLGGRGGDQCLDTATNPANPSLNAHNDDKGELINRGGVSGNPTVENTPSTELNSSNFLSWFPNVPTNAGHATPLSPAISVVGTAVPPAGLVGDFATLVEGVHEHGCGFEAQNEAWYRFLVQPDPFGSITRTGTHAQFAGIDATILQQRHDFLRPDSLLAIIVVTDENEEAADPLSIGGQGWAFDNGSFPGSPNGASPQGSTECLAFDPANPTTTGPNSSSCTSCAFIGGDPTRCPKDGANGANGYLDPLDDTLNTRFYHQKLRFGLFAGYPTSRYVRGMQSTSVPDSAHEHDSNGNYVGDQDTNANCVNPIYAQNLPTDPTNTMALCNLTRGLRDPGLVYYAAIAGVPHQLLQSKPGDGTCPTGTAAGDCPQKGTLTDADWKLIEGNDPEHYDFSGADFHMVENWDPRTTPGAVWSAEEKGPLPGNIMANASACPPTMGGSVKGQALCDPINGREWATSKQDLQFSCIFDLTPQYGGTGKDCSQQEYAGACDCVTSGINSGTQLCDSATPTLQVYGKAYPSVREMIIAKAMSKSTAGNQGIVSSLCPIHVSDQSGGSDPLFGYRPAVNAIIDRLKASLSNTCLPQKLTADTSGNVPCLILVQLGAAAGAGACANPGSACDPKLGLLGPGAVPAGQTNAPLSQDILTKFCASQEAAYNGMPGASGDPDTYPTCALDQLLPLLPNGQPNMADFPSGANGGCGQSGDPGWCYVEGAAANGCPQAILFTNGQPPHGATVSLQCIEQSVAVIEGGTSGGD